MSSGGAWAARALADVVELRRGFDLPHQNRRPGPFPVLTSGESGGWHDEGPVSGPGVTIGRATNLGRPKWSDGPYWPHNTTLYVSDFKGNCERWVFHLFETLELSGYDSGSVQPMLNRNYISRIQVPLPPLGQQQAIAEVLGALDVKTAANATLVSTADELAALRFEAMIGTGGESCALSSLAQFVNGRAFTKNATGTGRVVIRIAELNSGLGASTVYTDLDVADQYLARPGDLLFAWSGSLTVHRWFRAEGIVNQHIFKVIPTAVPLWVVNGALRAKLAEFKGIAADKATTMGHIQRHHLDEPVLVPAADVIDREDAAIQALWDTALQAERESLMLAELRDTLLPELMSGRLRVKDAEHVLEDVV